ncbi:MAG TPA: hypothetical protein DCP90_05085 [Clostridiales bacterium]|nr:MAG: hypothetical protein A2Y22_07090 [Clostridiales bacterium GWD2_32_59]HAN09973.1 hypothetical protein [Clostridiales bacterium]
MNQEMTQYEVEEAVDVVLVSEKKSIEDVNSEGGCTCNKKVVYFEKEPHTFDVRETSGGECMDKKIIIDESKYRLLEDEDGKQYLARYNTKHKMLICLKFADVHNDIKSVIVNTLETQFIERMLVK